MLNSINENNLDRYKNLRTKLFEIGFVQNIRNVNFTIGLNYCKFYLPESEFYIYFDSNFKIVWRKHSSGYREYSFSEVIERIEPQYRDLLLFNLDLFK